jgi:hypothetical protein
MAARLMATLKGLSSMELGSVKFRDIGYRWSDMESVLPFTANINSIGRLVN